MRKITTTMVATQFGTLVALLWLTTASSVVLGAPPTSKPGCPDRCGSVVIPYPFGIGSDCSANQTFTITCNTTTGSNSNSKPFLTSINLEVLEILLENKTMRLNTPVTTTPGCNSTGGRGGPRPPVNLAGTPFSYSTAYNQLTGIGCNSVAQLFDLSTTGGTAVAGCQSTCGTRDRRSERECYGINCCQTGIPSGSVKAFNVSLTSVATTGECRYGFIVEQEWFVNLTSPYDVEGMEHVPVVMDWRTDEKCYLSEIFDGIIISSDWDALGCYCRRGWEGNAYLPNGCVDINECEDPKYPNICFDGVCYNTPGGYGCDDPKTETKSNRTLIPVIIGVSTGLGGLILIIGSWGLWKIIKRRKESKLKKKFFKRNGGLLFQQQVPSSDQQGSFVEKTKLFTSKELEMATDHYNENRVLGRGGQGTVYKGMSTDGKIVAVKKSKVVDEGKLDEFINEVVILSQINHRNVVRLHGCCLETEVPLLVYEFIPNGTLLEYIQNQQNEEFPLTWNVRLRIASEVAGALAYLHSAASVPIYHRDIKSSNILLDEKYRAKVADFGTSRSVQVDQTHMTTRVQGTFGYFDPEYFRSSKYTAKSDVYSFGVVLLELLTGQKAIIQTGEGRGLAAYFITSMEEDRLLDIVDPQVLKEGGRDGISAMANLAKRCLSLNGKKRPTMKEVAMELDAIRTSTELTLPSSSPDSEEQYEEDEYNFSEIPSPWDTTSVSVTSGIEDKALMSN